MFYHQTSEIDHMALYLDLKLDWRLLVLVIESLIQSQSELIFDLQGFRLRDWSTKVPIPQKIELDCSGLVFYSLEPVWTNCYNLNLLVLTSLQPVF